MTTAPANTRYHLPRKLASLGAVALACAVTLGTASAAAPAYGKVKPYTLSVDALKDVTGKTDVTMTVNVMYSGFSAPASAAHIQLKSFDTSNVLRWTKNTQSVPLAPGALASTVVQSFTDTLRGQPISAFVQVQNSQTTNKENLYGNATVKLRPDIKVESIAFPDKVVKGQLVNISALLRELNGDLGAQMQVTLSDGNNAIDTASNVQVLANGASSAVFATIFQTAGTHTLTVTASGVAPGDYDNSNNTRTVNVEVVDNLQYSTNLPFYASYWGNSNDYLTEYGAYWGSGKYTSNYSYESCYASVSEIPVSASHTLDKVVIDLGGDGALNPALHYVITDLSSDYTWSQIDSNTYLYVYPWTWSNNPGCSLYVNHYAGQSVWFSEWHDTYYGTNGSNGGSSGDIMIKPTTSFDGQILVTSGGQVYGGHLSAPVTSYSNSYYYDYGQEYQQYGYDYYFGHTIYSNSYGSGYGVTTP